MTPLAHVGHWYHTIFYVLPVALIAAGLWWSGRREARERAEREARRTGPATEPPAGER